MGYLVTSWFPAQALPLAFKSLNRHIKSALYREHDDYSRDARRKRTDCAACTGCLGNAKPVYRYYNMPEHYLGFFSQNNNKPNRGSNFNKDLHEH